LLFPFEKRFENLAHVLMRPKRDYRLQSDWLEGEGTNPCRAYGPGYLVQRRLGDVCPFLERSLREKFVHVRQEVPWAESAAENARLALISAQEEGEGVEVLEQLQAWLEAVQGLENNEGFRNRIFPRIWRADRGLTTLHMAEQAVKNNHSLLEQPWEYANWNSLNFWALPRLEDLGLNPALDIPDPESPDDLPPLTTLINRSRSRALLWLNRTTFHGSEPATPDFYGSLTGSVTLEFWINARSSPTSVRPGAIFHVPGVISLVLLPQREVNPARSSEAYGGDERFHLAVVSEAAINALSATDPTNPDRIGVFFDANPGISTNWNANGWLASEPEIKRGTWHHCAVVLNPQTAQTLVYVDGRVAHARIYDAPLSPPLWWLRDTPDNPNPNAPEYLCMGARPFLDPAAAFDPITSPIDGEWVFNPTKDLDLEPSVVYGDPLDAELHSVRIWEVPLSRNQLLERRSGLLKDDPLQRRLRFHAQFNFRPDSPARPRVQLFDFYELLEEQTPLNTTVAWERGDVVLNLDGFLCDEVNKNWGLGVGYFSERIIIPELGQDGQGVESSDLYYAYCGVRNLAILPNDNPFVKPNSRTTKDCWDALDYAPWLRTDHVSVMFDAGTFLDPAIIAQEREVVRTINAIGEEGAGFALRVPPLQVFNRLRDRRTRASTFLEIQGLYYGSKVVPETFEWEANFGLEWVLRCLTSRAPIEIFKADPGDPFYTSIPFDPNPALATPYVRFLRDDPFAQRCLIRVKGLADGTLIRSNVQFPHLESKEERGTEGNSWKVGSIDIAHGMGVVHHPALWRMGELSTKIAFEGERGLWVKEFILPAPSGEWKSSNPNYRDGFADETSLPQNDPVPLIGNENTIGVTDITLYDRNLNAVIKAKMAQPIYRVPADKLAFKVKLDF
jgi:hypothetical protein